MKIALVVFLTIIFVIFRHLFNPVPLSGGDWIYLFPQAIKEITPFSAWDSTFNGAGQSIIPVLWHQSYSFLSLRIGSFLPWILYERLFWFVPFLLFSSVFAFVLSQRILKNKLLALFASFIYITNTYSLTLVSGGQMGVALAYSFLPLVIYFYLKLIQERNSLKNSIVYGLSLSLLLMFDLRFAYLSQVIVGLLFIWEMILHKSFKPIRILYFFVLPWIVTILLHAFWILPLILLHRNPTSQFSEIYSTSGAVRFFSFAKFENSLSLLHPNWPDNIFGKVSFMKPEFLAIPIFSYSFLLFRKIKANNLILFFAFLGVIGAFLAKGSNDVFGGVYLFLFDHIPGFFLFRDPTKWYSLIALSYSILLPFSIWHIFYFLKTRLMKILLAILLILYAGFILKPVLIDGLSGTFAPSNVPKEYEDLAKLIASDKSFYRLLWVPMVERYGFYSNSHPGINATDYFRTSDLSKIEDRLKDSETEVALQNLSVRYVVIPDDIKGELFLKDRKYDEASYQKAIKQIEKIGWLKESLRFNRVVLFEVPDYKEHFFSTSSNLSIKYKTINSVNYTLNLRNARKGDLLIFSDSFDNGWQLQDGEKVVSSRKYKGDLNSFTLERDGNYSLDVFYGPQNLVNAGIKISTGSLILILFFLVITQRKGYNTSHD